MSTSAKLGFLKTFFSSFFQKSLQNVQPQAHPKKKTEEGVFKFIFFFMLSLMMFLTKSVPQFRQFASENQISVLDLRFFLIVPATCTVIYIFKKLLYLFANEKITRILSKKHSGDDLVKSIDRNLKYAYSSTYHTLTSICVLYIFGSEYWYPTELGGQGNCDLSYREYPQFPDNERLIIYYMIQFSRHTYAFFELLLLKKERKFWEYMLHHFLAAVLIYFSLMLNFSIIYQFLKFIVYIGAIILILHDISDACLAIARLYGDLLTKKGDKFAYIFYLALLVSWIWTRIYVYPRCIIAQFKLNYENTELWNIIFYNYAFQNTEVIILYAMHVFWLYYMVKIGVNLITSQSYNNIHDRNSNQKKVE